MGDVGPTVGSGPTTGGVPVSTPPGGLSPAQRLVAVLARVPRPVVFLGVLALTLVGLVLHGVLGALVLAVLLVVLLALLSVSWPALSPGQRRMRVVVLVAVAAVAAVKVATGR